MNNSICAIDDKEKFVVYPTGKYIAYKNLEKSEMDFIKVIEIISYKKMFYKLMQLHFHKTKNTLQYLIQSFMTVILYYLYTI